MARSVEAAGHECVIEQYTDRPHDRHVELITLTKLVKPDFIVYIGSIEQYASCLPVPSVDILCKLNDIAPMIHLCGDACDSAWWSWLDNYDKKQCFALQVSIDGSFDNPIASYKNGMLALTPIDCRPFEPKPWSERSIRLGLVGGLGHTKRLVTITELINQKLLTFVETSKDRSYTEMAKILCDSQIILNGADNGTGNRQHVKGRVIEAGFAGCCLFESRGSPTNRWFVPGQEYFEYDGAQEVANILNSNSDFEITAVRFHNSIVREHHPKVFWGKVLDGIGLC